MSTAVEDAASAGGDGVSVGYRSRVDGIIGVATNYLVTEFCYVGVVRVEWRLCVGVEVGGEVRNTFDSFAATHEAGLALFDKPHMRASCAYACLGIYAAKAWLILG